MFQAPVGRLPCMSRGKLAPAGTKSHTPITNRTPRITLKSASWPTKERQHFLDKSSRSGTPPAYFHAEQLDPLAMRSAKLDGGTAGFILYAVARTLYAIDVAWYAGTLTRRAAPEEKGAMTAVCLWLCLGAACFGAFVGGLLTLWLAKPR
jgi:hypothetical protein